MQNLLPDNCMICEWHIEFGICNQTFRSVVAIFNLLYLKNFYFDEHIFYDVDDHIYFLILRQKLYHILLQKTNHNITLFYTSQINETRKKSEKKIK